MMCRFRLPGEMGMCGDDGDLCFIVPVLWSGFTRCCVVEQLSEDGFLVLGCTQNYILKASKITRGVLNGQHFAIVCIVDTRPISDTRSYSAIIGGTG